MSGPASDPSTPRTDDPRGISVVDHPDTQIYELLVGDDQVGLLVYRMIGARLTITHTMIRKDHRGQGLSWTLIGGALDDIATKGVVVSNYCPAVTHFIEQNPRYRTLLGGRSART